MLLIHRVFTALAILTLAGCGGKAPGGSNPIGPTPDSPFTRSGGQWIVNSETSSAHVGRFTAADGATLDVWRGAGYEHISDMMLRQSDGDTIRVRIDAERRPTYFEDPVGARFWVNQYFGDGSADVTVENQGESWRGIVDVSEGAVAQFGVTSAPFSSPSAGPSVVAGAGPANLDFCDPKVLRGVKIASAGICAVSVAATILSKGLLAKTLLHCARDTVLIELLEAQMCPYVNTANVASGDPARVTTAPLGEGQSPIPPAPAIPIAAPAPTLADAYVVDMNGRLAAVNTRGDVRLIGHMGVVMTDVASGPNGTLYGLSFTDFYTVDPGTARVTRIGSHSVPGGNALAFAPNGVLYAAGSSSTALFTINPATGASTSLGNMGFASGGDLAFHGGNFFLAASTNQLVRVNLANPSFGVPNVFGLSTGPDGVLYGVGGTLIFAVNMQTGAAMNAASFGGKGLSDAFGMSFPAR